MKDTIWYLCSILHSLISFQPDHNIPIYFTLGDMEKSRLELLKKAILDVFMGILISRPISAAQLEKSKDVGQVHSSAKRSDSNSEAQDLGNRAHGTLEQKKAGIQVLLDASEHRMLLRVLERFVNMD